MGGTLAIDGDVSLHASANAPPGTTLVLLRNGLRLHEVTDAALEANGGGEPGTYRIEAYTDWRSRRTAGPWIVSNPIYVGVRDQPPSLETIAPPQSRIPARTSEAAAESGPSDTSRIDVAAHIDAGARTFPGDPAFVWSFALSPGAATGQFAAAAIPVCGRRRRRSIASVHRVGVGADARVGPTACAGRRHRAVGSYLLRGWRPRIVDVPFARFRSIGLTSSAQPPLERVDSLLFVVDTLNTLPGTKGQLTIGEVGFVK